MTIKRWLTSTTIAAAVSWCCYSGGAQAQQTPFPVQGSTKGVVTANPEWSTGVQLGNYNATGIVVQKLGFYDGALNAGLGLALGSPSLHLDYLWMMNSRFQPKGLGLQGNYNTQRGELMPYVGGGLQVGEGFSFRVPAGMQYTMLKDPFNFYGGLALVVGKFFTDDDDDNAKIRLWFNLGARMLL